MAANPSTGSGMAARDPFRGSAGGEKEIANRAATNRVFKGSRAGINNNTWFAPQNGGPRIHQSYSIIVVGVTFSAGNAIKVIKTDDFSDSR